MKLLRPKYVISTFTVIFSLFAFTVKAQIITTVAGNGTSSFSGDGGLATAAGLSPEGICFDNLGNMYIAANSSIRKVDVNGKISTVAGNANGLFYYLGDGYKATSISLDEPRGVLVDAAGNIYIAEPIYNRVLKVSTDGIMRSIAGNGYTGYSNKEEGGLATNATLDAPSGIAMDKAGNLYIADNGHGRIRKVTPGGIITTIAGNNTIGYSGDGGLATNASLNAPFALAFDAVGNLYIADASENRIRKIDTKGIITTVAGNGKSGFSGDGGLAINASFDNMLGITVDASGNIYVSDEGNQRIRKVDANGIVSTLAGNGLYGFEGDGVFAPATSLSPFGLTIDANGNLYVCDPYNYRVRKFNTNISPIVIASISPVSATQGDTVTIKGQNFTGVSSVSFGGTAATNYTIANDSTIYAVVGNGKSGSIVLKSAITAGQIQGFNFYIPKPVPKILSFQPQVAGLNDIVYIYGRKFTNTSLVTFGGVRAGIMSINDSVLKVVIYNEGATGSVKVVTPIGTDSLSGFTFAQPPIIDLPIYVSNYNICKKKPVTFTIDSTKANVMYGLMDSAYNVIGTPVEGNGGTISFSYSIPYDGKYRIFANNVGRNGRYPFSNVINLKHDKIKSSFVVSKVNVLQNEPFNIVNLSTEAQTFDWYFGASANIKNSSLPKVQGVSFTDTGLKAIQLISTSAYGCKDTLIDEGVYVYTKPSTDEVCYGVNIDDSDFYNMQASPTTIAKISLANDNGFFVSGYGNKPILKSRYGISKKINFDGTAYFASYSTDGVLRWCMKIKELSKDFLNTNYGFSSSNFYGSTQDSLGNIYIIGSCRATNYLFLPNGDSIMISKPADEIFYPNAVNGEVNGFILKVDSLGNYLWHTIIRGGLEGGIPHTIKITKGKLLVSGNCVSPLKLKYYKNGTNTVMVNSPYVSVNYATNNFILKIDTDGNYNWSTCITNDAHNLNYKIADIVVDALDNSFILGEYEQNAVFYDLFDSTITLNGSTGTHNTYLIKLDRFGRKIWYLNYGSSVPNELVCDEIGNTYIVGQGTNISSNNVFVVNNSDKSKSSFRLQGYHLFKVNNNGIINWGVGSEIAFYGYGYAVCLNKGNVYTAFTLSKWNNVDNFTLTSTNSSNITKAFYESEFIIAKYDTSGVLYSANGSGNNNGGHITPNHLVIDHANNFLISGILDRFNGGGATANIFNSNIPRNGIDGFFLKLNSNFCSGTTPVTLISFAAVAKQKDVLLNWHTATELNSSHFIIQHCTDGTSFTDIGSVKAIGSGANGYQFTDNNPTLGINYYRLKSVDKDGSFAYSKVVSVQFTVNSNQLTVFPNPAKDKATIKGNHIASVQVVDNLGRIIKTQILKDATNPILSVGSLPVGVYHLRVQTTDGKVSGVGFVKE